MMHRFCTKSITIGEVEHISFRLALDMFIGSEPIPDFELRFPGILESCLEQPFQVINDKELYPTLINKASILFYLCIKNHPFLNGNKRIAIFVLFLFLHKNGRNIETTNEKIYELAVCTAKSKTREMKKTLMYIEKFLEGSITSS